MRSDRLLPANTLPSKLDDPAFDFTGITSMHNLMLSLGEACSDSESSKAGGGAFEVLAGV